jgi:hypothetical protein
MFLCSQFAVFGFALVQLTTDDDTQFWRRDAAAYAGPIAVSLTPSERHSNESAIIALFEAMYQLDGQYTEVADDLQQSSTADRVGEIELSASAPVPR